MPHLTAKYVDLAGVGFGPANIALAIALEEGGFAGTAQFIEKGAGPGWQSEMMVAGADIQHNPLRDFVTPLNPASRYGFLSYLKATNRLWDYLNLSTHYPPRSEYAEYVKWVARQFGSRTAYGNAVCDLGLAHIDGTPRVILTFDDGRKIFARAVSIGCGRSLYIPAPFSHLMGPRVAHTQSYLSTLAGWRQTAVRRIAVIGASQSAAEVTLDLRSRPDDFEVFNITSGVGYRQKDLSPFTETIYYPEYVDFFFQAHDQEKKRLLLELRNSNYGAADSDVIEKIFLRLYEQKVDGHERLHILSNTTICRAEPATDGGITFDLAHRFRPDRWRLSVDAVLLATGFRNLGGGERDERHPPLLNSIAEIFKRRADGSLLVTRDYRLVARHEGIALPPIYLNGLCESTHGFGDAGSFSLLALRASTMARSIIGSISLPPIDDLTSFSQKPQPEHIPMEAISDAGRTI